MTFENKILKSFKKKMGKEVENLDLIFSETDIEPNTGCVMETCDNGRVWDVKYTNNGVVTEINEL